MVLLVQQWCEHCKFFGRMEDKHSFSRKVFQLFFTTSLPPCTWIPRLEPREGDSELEGRYKGKMDHLGVILFWWGRLFHSTSVVSKGGVHFPTPLTLGFAMLLALANVI